MSTAMQIQTQVDELQSQKQQLEQLLQSKHAEIGRITARRQEVSASAYLGDKAAQRELETYTSEAIRQAQQAENIGFAIEEVDRRITDAKEALVQAMEQQTQERIKALAEERISKTETLPDAMGNLVSIIADLQAIDKELERLIGRDRWQARNGSYALDNFISEQLHPHCPGIDFGSFQRGDLMDATRRVFARFLQ